MQIRATIPATGGTLPIQPYLADLASYRNSASSHASVELLGVQCAHKRAKKRKITKPLTLSNWPQFWAGRGLVARAGMGFRRSVHWDQARHPEGLPCGVRTTQTNSVCTITRTSGPSHAADMHALQIGKERWLGKPRQAFPSQPRRPCGPDAPWTEQIGAEPT